LLLNPVHPLVFQKQTIVTLSVKNYGIDHEDLGLRQTVKSKLIRAKETKKATRKALIRKKNLFRDQSLSC